jgi:HAMP domain-containing protein
MRILWSHCLSSRGRATAVGRGLTLWLLCAVCALTCAAPARAQQAEVVDSGVVLSCGEQERDPVLFAYHRTTLDKLDAEAFSVILRTSARPNKVFSLYRYGLNPKNVKRDNVEGTAGQVAYDSGKLIANLDNFLTASLGQKGCADSAPIAAVLTTLITYPPGGLLDVVKGTYSGAGAAEGVDSPFAKAPATGAEFSNTVFKFGAELGFGEGGVDPESLSKAELNQQKEVALKERDVARAERDAAKIDSAMSLGVVGYALTRLDEATWSANIRWWVILGTLGYSLLATAAWLALSVRARRERRLRPVLEQAPEIAYPKELKEALAQIVEDTDKKRDEIVQETGKQNAPLLSRDRFKLEHRLVAEQIEKLFLLNGYAVPRPLDDEIAGAKSQYYSSWQFVPFVGGAVHRVLDAVRGSKSKYNEKDNARADYVHFVMVVGRYLDDMKLREDGRGAGAPPAQGKAAGTDMHQTAPAPAAHPAAAPSLDGLASTVKETVTTEVNPVLKQTVEDAISAEFKTHSDELIKLLESSHASRDVLDRVRAAMPLAETGRELSDAEVESHLKTLFSGVREVCDLAPVGKRSSADSVLDEVRAWKETYQRLRKNAEGIDGLSTLLAKLEARISGYNKALAPLRIEDEDLVACAQRVVADQQKVADLIKDSAAFQYLVGRDNNNEARRTLPERVSEIAVLAGEVPQLRKNIEEHLGQMETLRKERDDYQTRTTNLTNEVTTLKGEIEGKKLRIGELEKSAEEFGGTYEQTVNGFLRHLSFRPEEANPSAGFASSLRALRERADRAVNEKALFKSLRLRLLPGVELLEKEIAEAEGRGRGDVILALSLKEEDRKLNIVENLKRIISRLEDYCGEEEKLWEFGLLDGFAGGWLHLLLRADRLLHVYFADSAELAGLRHAVKGVALSFEVAMRELGISLLETKLLSPIPPNRAVTRTKVGEITKVPEVKNAVELTRRNGDGFVVDIIHFGLGGRSGVNEEVRIALLNPVDWA